MMTMKIFKKGDKTVFEYEIINIHTGEHDFIHGYSRMDAWKRCTWLNRDEWQIVAVDYID